MSKFEEGDIVRIGDGSYAVRVDGYQRASSIGRSEREFSVVGFPDYTPVLRDREGDSVHDIYIKDRGDGKVYLHSSCSLRKVEHAPKKMTVAEVSKLAGCPVEIIEG